MKRRNEGSAVVEACVVIPLFLFFMLFIIYLYRMIYVDAHIHQCLCEAAVYCAKRCYLEDRLMKEGEGGNTGGKAAVTDTAAPLQDGGNDIGTGGLLTAEPGIYTEGSSSAGSGESTEGLSLAELGVSTGIIYAQFNKYMGNDPMVKQVVAGGQKGILITVEADEADRNTFVAKASYMTKIDVPIFGSFMFPRSNEVKQKAFLGYSSEDGVDEDESYVYVTPNESVYHVSRSCSHLKRSVRAVSGHGGYEPCKFCGKEETGGQVYVTENGDAYHCNLKCLGLKRTVKRVRKKTVAGLRVCSLCGR